MKLTVDCILSASSPDLRNTGALAQLLAKGKLSLLETALEALICEQYGLQATPDYPIAAISAAVDGLDVNDAYWLRADAVNLVLQRDCFSLGEPIPLAVMLAHADLMIASLNQHFKQDGLVFLIGHSGAWYLRIAKSPHIKTTLPSVACGKNVHQFLPQGMESSRWLAVLNEVQMLLHEHTANAAREASGQVAVNSVWFSGGGVMPPVKMVLAEIGLIFSNSVFYQGLAKWAGATLLALPDNLPLFLQNTTQQENVHIRLQLPVLADDRLDSYWFKPLLSALKNRKIKQLSLNIGFYEKTLTVDITPIDTYKFWRKAKPVMDYLQ